MVVSVDFAAYQRRKETWDGATVESTSSPRPKLQDRPCAWQRVHVSPGPFASHETLCREHLSQALNFLPRLALDGRERSVLLAQVLVCLRATSLFRTINEGVKLVRIGIYMRFGEVTLTVGALIWSLVGI